MNMALFSVDTSGLIFSGRTYIMLFVIYIVFSHISNNIHEKFRIVESFNPASETYGETVAVIKSRNRFFRMSSLHYNVNGQEFSLTVPYYLKSDSASVIYTRAKPNKAILYDYELLHRTMKKYRIISRSSLTIGLLLVMGVILILILIANGGGDK